MATLGRYRLTVNAEAEAEVEVEVEGEENVDALSDQAVATALSGALQDTDDIDKDGVRFFVQYVTGVEPLT